MKIFKLQDHLKGAGAATDVAGVYWSSRDMGPSPVGNHHFFTFVYEDESQAQRIAASGIAETFSEENDKGVRIYFATLGVNKDEKTEGIIIESSPKMDRKAIKEISKEKNTSFFSYDLDFQGHRVLPESAAPVLGSSEQLMMAISEKVDNFNAHFSAGDRIPYSLVDENCACIVNTLMKTLGYEKNIREKLGEFWGVDWGEEDLVSDCYFEKMCYVCNSNTKEVHLPCCEWARRIEPRNKSYSDTIEQALAQGYNGCHYCLDGYDTD